MLKKIEACIEAHEQEMLRDAMDLIAINSERMEEKPGMPFGEGNAAVFAKAREIMERHSFPVKNYDNYVLTADLNEKPSRLDILAHLDVVPAGDGCTVCNARGEGAGGGSWRKLSPDSWRRRRVRQRGYPLLL